MNDKTALVLAGIILVLYAAFLIYRALSSGKSEYELEMEMILASEKYKVKGRFE